MTVKQMTCTHKWQIDRHNVGTCSVCGEVRQFPWDKAGEVVVLTAARRRGPGRPRKDHHNHNHSHQYLETNKDAITADLLAIGNTATCKKWGIKPQTMTGLKERWLTAQQRAAIFWERGGRRAAPAQNSPPSPNGHLPHFPEFSGTWDPSVQLKWLEVYQNLHIKENNK
jgi:hypothetical protein